MVDVKNLIEMRSITKSFGGVHALKSVNFDLRPGEIHALMGENGAGKTTLMKILDGVYTMDAGGGIYIDGQKREINSPKIAKNYGISVIWQEFALMPHLSVAENIFIDSMGDGKKTVSWKALHKRAREILDRLGYSVVNETADVASLSTAQQQVVEICKALARKSNVLVLDEPTSLLATSEVVILLDLLRSLRDQGTSIVYISHRLDEVFSISDRITVLKDGEYVKTVITKETSKDQLINLMIGRSPKDLYPVRSVEIGEVIFKVENLNRGRKVKNISFELRKGEVLGIGGLVGAGRTETVRAVFGADKKDSGNIYLDGKIVEIRKPNDAFKMGIGLLPEDRKGQGVLLDLEIRITSTLSCIKRKYNGFMGKIMKKQETEDVIQINDRLKLKHRSIDDPVNTLSGGNQQKVAISKLLAAECNILLMDEPTRGVDVGAKIEIYKIINELVEKGNSVVIVSSEMMELMGMCDRVIIVREGEVTRTLHKEEITEQNMIKLAMGAG